MTDSAAHRRRRVEAWRSQRYAALRRDTGWLTLAGLDWLRPGVNRIGTAADGEIVLLTGPAEAGTLTLTDDGVRARRGARRAVGRRRGSRGSDAW